MASYAFWNNKGGVGKSFLCFVAAGEYARNHPEADVYVIDLCPQANLSETLLGGFGASAEVLTRLYRSQPRRTVAGYIEARLNSPFTMIEDVSRFVVRPHDTNADIPENLMLVCGDNLLEILSEAIRQTSQLAVPVDSWKRVIMWIEDLCSALRESSDDRDALFIIDCNPSFAVYTQLALVAAEQVVVPFTADDSSRRGIENVIALLFGIGDEHTASYARISFAKRAKEDGVRLPRLGAFVSNRVTVYRGRASRAFAAARNAIAGTVDDIYSKHRTLFARPGEVPSSQFIEIPDYHSACVVASMQGTPLHRLRAGPHDVAGERIQINQEPLTRYREALQHFVSAL